jgi:hypothetical protein
MAEPKIELRKVRDFGANLSDTFEFIGQNFKPMVYSFFAISGIFILLQAITNGVFQSRIFSGLGFGGNVHHRNVLILGNLYDQYFSPIFFLFLFFAWLAYVAMQVCIGAYMKYYDEHDGAKAGIEDVWHLFVQYYLKVLIFTLPIGLIILTGCLFCLLPGIYLWVVFAPFPFIVMMEDASLGETIQRCFELIRQNFWISLGIYIVTTLIYSFASAITGFIIGVVSGLLTYLTTRDLSATIGIVTSVLRVFGFLFYIIFLVSVMLHYFNLVERRDATGMMRRIDQIGGQPDDGLETAEQY